MCPKSKKISERYSGMTGFTVVWAGQFISMLGSGMVNFAIMIWLWKITGKATPFATYGVISTVARIAGSPLAGALVDRWNRKFTMAISDLVSGLSSVLILVIYFFGELHVWHLYVLGAVSGFFGTFQFPAFSAATTMMVSKENYARANGMVSVADAISEILSPILAAALIGFIGLPGILIIDIITFTIAVGVLFLVHIPQPTVSKEGLEGKGSIWQESMYGFSYLYRRKSLFGLLLVFLAMNMSMSFIGILQAPMILARSGDSEWILSGVQSASTIGGLICGLVLMFWGGPKNRIRGLFVAMTFLGIGAFIRGVGEGFLIWAVGGFISSYFGVLANACSQAFWQAKVAPDVQGRVFSARRMIGQVASPLAMMISGFLADHVFEPGMVNGGVLAQTFGWIVGTEHGSGFALMFLFAGLLATGVAVGGYMFRAIRHADTILPDHDVNSQSVGA